MRKLKLEELNRPSVEEFKASADKLPVVVILDNVRSALNVGSIFRTCDGLAIEKLILVGITAQPPHKEINKTAIGATNSVEWVHYDNMEEACAALKGHLIIAVEQTDSSIPLQEFELPDQPLAIILGNEVEGVSEAALNEIDTAIEIPQFGTKHSFNVAVCTGMVLWELSRQFRYKG